MPSGLQTARDYSRASFRIGSAQTRSATAGVAGPRPFRFGAFSKSAALVKLAHAVVAAQINNRIAQEQAAKEAEAAKQAEELRGYQLSRAKDLATPPTPEELTAESKARRLGTMAAETEAGPRGPVPEALRKKIPGLPAELPLATIKDYEDLYGEPKPSTRKRWMIGGEEVPESVYAAHWKTKHGLPTSADGSFDAITEGERSREAGARDAVEEVRRRRIGQWQRGELTEVVNEKGQKVPAPAYSPMDLLGGATPAWLDTDPEVVKAKSAVLATRAGNFLNSIGRARDFESLMQGLGRTYVGDPLLRVPAAGDPAGPALERVGRVRREAILRAIDLARDRNDLERLFQLTEDPEDPLNQDPDVRTKLAQRAAALR